jgi:drug/metabolite transporter (DMT)-like permease
MSRFRIQRMSRNRTLTVLAFSAIYLIWGSRFLAIRIAVETTPPLFAASLRFVLPGALLYLWARAHGASKPCGLEWRNMTIQAALLFLISYGGLFWAEKTIPSGIASILTATVPAWTALLQVCVMRREPFRWSLPAGIVLGLAGVTVLTFTPGARLNLNACLVLLAAQVSWSLGTVLSKIFVLPKSMLINSGAQMLLGGLMLLACSSLSGELRPLPHVTLRAGWAILYLAVAGSIIAFTSYIWLLNRMRATVVTSYAYVNPVVALLLGYWFGNETLGVRTVAGAALVLLSVAVVMRD